MKISNLVLLIVGFSAVAALLASNYVMKEEYEKIDRSDPYWNYITLTDKPFSHLVVNGGNISNIVYEESSNYYVKAMTNWRGSADGSIKTFVSNDTLFVGFENRYNDMYEKQWLMNTVPVRISGPRLVSVSTVATKLFIERFNHPHLNITAASGSKVLINSYNNVFDEIRTTEADSSLISLSMSTDLLVREAIRIRRLHVTGTGTSLLNIHSSLVDSSSIHITDSAAVAINGYSLKRSE